MYINIPLLKKMYRLLRPFRKYYILIVFATIVSQILFNINNIIYGKLIEVITVKNIDSIILFVILATTLAILIWLTEFFIDYTTEVKCFGYDKNHLRSILLPQLFKLNIKQHNNLSSVKLAEESNTGIDAIANINWTLTTSITNQLSYTIVAIIVLFYQNLYIGLLSLLAIIIVSVIENKFIKNIQPLIKDRASRNITFSKIFRESISNITLFKYLGINQNIIDKVSNLDDKRNTKNRVLSKKQNIYYAIRNLIVTIFNLLIVVFSIYLYYKGYITQGIIVVVIFSVWGLLYNAKQLQHSLSGLSEQYENASKYLNLLDIETEFLEGGDKPFSNGDIEVNNLSFSYNDNDDRNATLHNISLTIPQNKRVAFVGHSGSGKSTIIKLILRAFDYDNGSIKIGGAELKDLDIIDFRQHTGYVQQHVELLDDTLKNNLLIGVDDKTMRKLIKSNKLDYLLDKVCKIAKIDQFYNRLGDKGLECIVGEKGVRLSGGEVQRVGIARAIIRDPEILILDEATSSLDSINEHFITEAVDAVSKNRTTIIIAHRLSTIIKSDIIFVLSKGNIVGQGTHNTLLKSCPEYKELVEHQEFVN